MEALEGSHFPHRSNVPGGIWYIYKYHDFLYVEVSEAVYVVAAASRIVTGTNDQVHISRGVLVFHTNQPLIYGFPMSSYWDSTNKSSNIILHQMLIVSLRIFQPD